MATVSPSPNSSPSAASPPASAPPPPQSSSPPTPPPTSPSSQPNVNSPTPPTTSPSSQPNVNSPDPASPRTHSPPPQSPPSQASPPPPPQAPVTSPSPTGSSSPVPPTTSPPPKLVSPSPPPPVNSAPPSSNSPPPPSSNPPASSPPPPSLPLSPPPPSAVPPPISLQPPSSNPPRSSPPPPASESPKNSPPPPPSKTPPSSPPPPGNSPPPPSSKPPEGSPPPPASKPPQNSPPPTTSSPPVNSPPPPAAMPPGASPPPPQSTPASPPPSSPPSSNSPPKTPPPSSPPSSISPPKTPPPSIVHQPPPPPSLLSPPSLSPSSQVPIPPSGNPTINNPSGNAPEKSNSTGNGGLGTGASVAIGLVLGFILLSLLGTAAWCIKRRKKDVSELNGGYMLPTSLGSSPKSDSALVKAQSSSAHHFASASGSDYVYSSSEPGGLGNSRSWFTYEELVVATNGFSVQNLLGEGGFGCVYKGYLADGREVAVKELKIGGGQGEREFRAEVEIISRIHHRHLVSLVGYCISDNRRLLVYDYVPNNTLHFHLHGKDRPVMDWTRRVKIAAGAARGIAYLHEDCHPRVIHRDIKSANILLDNNFDARVSDFGLAKLALDANTHITTRVMGTFGYMAPEYASSGKLTEKSDVFSFGVVLLELITGRKPVDSSQPLGEESLVEWARPLLNQALDTEEFEGLTDPRLEKNYIDSEMFLMIEAAAACVRHSAAKRPRMGQVVRAFDSMAATDLTNGMRVGESEIFNSAQQSAEIRLFQRMAFGNQDYSTDFFSQSSLNN